MLAVSAGACAEPRQEAVLTRLISSGRNPGEIFDPQVDLSLRSAWQAKIAGPAGLSAWSFYVPSAAAKLAAPGGGIDLGPLRESQYLVWTGHLDTGSIDVLRFRFQESLAGQVELYWNGEGEDFAPQRYLLQSPDPRDPHQAAFDLSATRHWRGTVIRIGLRLLNQPLLGQALLQAEGMRYVATESLGHGETRYIVLDGRGMHAWLARPGTSIRRRLDVPREARLRFHAAPWLPDGGGVSIKIVARGRHRSQVLVDRELRQSADPPRRRWTGIEADLRLFAGETVDLLFQVGPAPRGSLVIWGSPQVVGAVGERRPNVLLISLDTVRADHLSLYGYRRQTTPNLEAWARRWATVFETTVASAPWTLPSHVSMFSGVDAVHHGVNRHGPIPLSLPLVPQRFRDAGYVTYATTAGVLLTPELGFARGFDDFHVRGKMESLPEWNAELGMGVTDALRWLMSHCGERFFLFLHTFEAHSPYQPREPYFSNFGGDQKALNGGQPVWMEAAGFDADVRPLQSLFHPPAYADGVTYPKRALQPQDRELATALYDSGLAHIDRQLSRLFEYLESEGLLKNTIVVVTSDHGESLYEHGLVGHSSLYDHDLLVPLVISAPLDAARGRRVHDQVRSVDIAPTLVQLAGLAPLNAIDGSSLVPFLRGDAATPRDAWSYALSTTRGVSLRNGGRQLKLIAQDTIFGPFRGGLEAYDLRRDPGESHNLSLGAATDRSWQRLAQEVRAGGQALQIRIANAGPGELSGELGGNTIDAMVTSPDLSFLCCKVTPTGIHFRAPAGADFTLMLHDRPAGTLRLKLTIADQTWQDSIPLAGIPPGLRVVWEERRWQSVIGEARTGAWTGTGIAIRREGPLEATPANEEQIRSKLRALGYIR
jgi:arylsulfatase A-like enzyme